jgi:hypothetical protein
MKRAALTAEIRVFLRSQLIATNVRVTSWPTSHGKDLDLVEVMADFIEQREKQPAALPDATGTP